MNSLRMVLRVDYHLSIVINIIFNKLNEDKTRFLINYPKAYPFEICVRHEWLSVVQ